MIIYLDKLDLVMEASNTWCITLFFILIC